jgi:hypothetical protein
VPRKSKAPDKSTAPAEGNAGTTVASADPPKSPRRKSFASRKSKAVKNGKQRAEISDDAIRLRAYFLGEMRIRQSLPGDPQSDWLEARRQLLAELSGE